MYGGARVVEEFPLRNRKGDRSSKGIRGHAVQPDHRRARSHQPVLSTACRTRPARCPTLPNSEELRSVRHAALQDTVRRRRPPSLRSRAHRNRGHTPLNIVFTCEIPWVASKPWEFAYDPDRRKFLATEEIHFIRNVFTAVPAQWVDRRTRLRMLVVEAQPDRHRAARRSRMKRNASVIASSRCSTRA